PAVALKGTLARAHAKRNRESSAGLGKESSLGPPARTFAAAPRAATAVKRGSEPGPRGTSKKAWKLGGMRAATLRIRAASRGGASTEATFTLPSHSGAKESMR